jgi:hypothetical protein
VIGAQCSLTSTKSKRKNQKLVPKKKTKTGSLDIDRLTPPKPCLSLSLPFS